MLGFAAFRPKLPAPHAASPSQSDAAATSSVHYASRLLSDAQGGSRWLQLHIVTASTLQILNVSVPAALFTASSQPRHPVVSVFCMVEMGGQAFQTLEVFALFHQ